MDIQEFNNTQWSRNVILVDGDYVDSVAFDLTVNFERMLGRRVNKADTARWIDCIALDGGMREGRDSNGETQVIFIHSKDKQQLDNFNPGSYENNLNAIAFKDSLGEFIISSYPVEEVVKHDDFFLDILKLWSTTRMCTVLWPYPMPNIMPFGTHYAMLCATSTTRRSV